MWWLLKPLVYFPGLLLAGVVPLAAVFLGWVGGGSRHKVLVTFILLGLLTGLVWRPTTSPDRINAPIDTHLEDHHGQVPSLFAYYHEEFFSEPWRRPWDSESYLRVAILHLDLAIIALMTYLTWRRRTM